MATSLTSLIGETAIQRIAQEFRPDDVNRCLALLEDVNIGLDREPVAIARAKNRFSELLGRVRAGQAQVIQTGRGAAPPVVMLSAVVLVRLMCIASSSVTVGDIMKGLQGAPALFQPLRIVNRGGKRQKLSLPDSGLSGSSGRESAASR